MARTRTKTHRAIAFGIVTIVAVLVATLEALAQQPTSSDQLNTLMSNRLELSRRSVDDTLRRRLEDKKSDSTFPSDGRTTKAGVTRALSPEQQKAFQHNERGIQFFVKGKLDSAIKEYQEAIRFDPQLALAHNNLGSAYFSGSRFEEAAAEFQKAS